MGSIVDRLKSGVSKNGSIIVNGCHIDSEGAC